MDTKTLVKVLLVMAIAGFVLTVVLFIALAKGWGC